MSNWGCTEHAWITYENVPASDGSGIVSKTVCANCGKPK